MERFDVVIVGGGPAGTSAAHTAAENGADTVVIEKGVPRSDREELGPDSTDAAGMLDYWLDIMDLDPADLPDGVILQELDGAEFIGPNKSVSLTQTGVPATYDGFGFTFHRARFDDWLRSEALEAGAEYRVGTGVRSVETTLEGGHEHLVTLRDGDELITEYVILADGPQRTVTIDTLDQFMPEGTSVAERIGSNVANHIAYQEYREFPDELFEPEWLKFWWGFIPGHTAYPWVFPNDDNVCRVGLTMPIGLDLDDVEDREDFVLLEDTDERVPAGRVYIRRLLEYLYGDEYDVDADFPLVEDRGKRGGTEAYPISSTRPIESPVEAGIAVTGGAMGATSAFHEGGDHVAVRTGKLAGELAAKGDIERYNDAWHDAIGNEIQRNVALADIVRGYTPSDWDTAFGVGDRVLRTDGNGLFKLRGAGVTGSRLVAKYKRTKFKYRNKRYAQLTESEYEY